LGLSEIAFFGRVGNAERAGDLAKAVSELPLRIAGVGYLGWEHTYELFARYDEKYADSYVSPGKFTRLLNESRLRLDRARSH
jgi:hypothetical protein